MSIGIPGQWDHPRVKEAEAHVIKTALRLGVAPRVEIDTPDQARPYLEMGVRHFCMGWDVGILFDWFKSQGAALRAMVKP
jgi:2-keto-3-deoxy-L-rhamnonate aldolase RhmA